MLHGSICDRTEFLARGAGDTGAEVPSAARSLLRGPHRDIVARFGPFPHQPGRALLAVPVDYRENLKPSERAAGQPEPQHLRCETLRIGPDRLKSGSHDRHVHAPLMSGSQSVADSWVGTERDLPVAYAAPDPASAHRPPPSP